MKKSFFFLCFLVLTFVANGQDIKLGIGGGYVFANSQQGQGRLSGFRVNGIYEYQTYRSRISHGLGFSYVNTSGPIEKNQVQQDQEVWMVPFSYQPKYYFSEESARAYIKPVLGINYSQSTVTVSSRFRKEDNIGFFGAAAAGIESDLGYNGFMTVEYKFSYVPNGFFDRGLMHSLQVGIAFRY